VDDNSFTKLMQMRLMSWYWTEERNQAYYKDDKFLQWKSTDWELH